MHCTSWLVCSERLEMKHLRLGAILYNISVLVWEKVTHFTDSYDVPHLPTPTTPHSPRTHLLQLFNPGQQQL